MNLLMLSVGTRNKLVQYFKNALAGKGKLIATDHNRLAPALYISDSYYIVPKINDKKYIDELAEICQRENITAILSLIDPELSLIALNRQVFEDLDVTLIMSDFEVAELCLNKYAMYKALKEKGFNCAQSYIDIDEFKKDLDSGVISFPVFVKPINGSASININKADDWDDLVYLWKKQNSLMIQQYMSGTEYGADCYVDLLSGKTVSIFVKKKLKMRAGETDKSVSIKDQKLFDLITRFNDEFGFRGVIDIDIFEMDGEYYISEVNPRFGGGYPHAHECGIDFPKMIVNNLENKVNRPQIGNYQENIYMMKHSEVTILREE